MPDSLRQARSRPPRAPVAASGSPKTCDPRPVRISCGKGGNVAQRLPAPVFGPAAEAFVIAHVTPGAWTGGTAVKYRQHPSALAARLASSAAAPGAVIAVIATPAAT